jgi:aryl-alcohol dehydrogenase-like predicted oxidoreductase
MEALDAVVTSGKARYIGASSMAAWQFAKMQRTAELGGSRRFVTCRTSTAWCSAKRNVRCSRCSPTNRL